MSSAPIAPPSRRRGGALLAVGIASSVFFLWLVFRNADLHAVWRALEGADLGLVLLAAVVIQGVYVAQGARWRLIAGTLELSVRRFYALVLGGIGANNVLPLRIGDLLRARWLATSAEIPSGRAFGSVFRDRACDVLTLVVALAVSLPFVGDAAWVDADRGRGRRPARVLALVVAAAVVYSRTRPRARRETGAAPAAAARHDRRGRLADRPAPARSRALARASSPGACGRRRRPRLPVARDLALPDRARLRDGGDQPRRRDPSSPGFIGTYQWLAVSALGVVGVDGDVAIAFSLLMQAIWFIPTTIVGGVIAIARCTATRFGIAIGASTGDR